MHDGRACGATTKASGRPCRNPARLSGYCRIHELVRLGRPPSPPETRKSLQVFVRREETAKRWLEGESAEAIAATLNVPVSTVLSDLSKLRAQGRNLPYGGGRSPRTRSLSPDDISSIQQMWAAGSSLEEIGTVFGWTVQATAGVIRVLRRKGLSLPRRRGRCPKPPARKVRLSAVRALRRHAQEHNELSQAQRPVLRLLRAVRRPLSIREIACFLREAGIDVSDVQVKARLYRLRERGLVANAKNSGNSLHQRHRLWFVPVRSLQVNDDSLTLADAAQEIELARLIEGQEKDLNPGHVMQAENGHFYDKSIDAPLTEDGFTILDTLADQDDVLAEMGQAA